MQLGGSSTAVSLVFSAVQKEPSGPALRYLGTDRSIRALNYKQVWSVSGQIAARLTGQVLGVAIDDGPYLGLAELAGWRRGMVLVPLDPHDPVSRLQAVASEALVSCIVTKDWGDAKKLTDMSVVSVLDLSLEVPLTASACEELLLEVSVDSPSEPDAAAYMWFTSGSTGTPKGILISHRAFHNWCTVKNEAHGISSCSTVLIASASTFDPSIGDIFATWAIGGVVAAAPRMLFFAHLGWVINQLEVTHVTCTPSLWQFLEAEDMALPTLSALCLGGERSPQPLLDQWTARTTTAVLNTYGTTECTVWQTVRRMKPGDRATLVGRAYPGNALRVLERGGTAALPDGEQGEIVQGGVQVGMRYHNRPELTAEKFVALPALGGGRWYRTGDGGRRSADGELEVLGRFDNQVKIRGMRVELGDIEASVVKASSGLLSNCTVVLRHGFLHAYCQVASSALVMMLEAYCVIPVVSDFLLQRSSLELPRHMLPSRFVLAQHLPLTTNGKVDSKRLPQVVEVAAGTSSSLTALESLVAGVWSDVLGRKGNIGPNDHFLALGGHSLSVLQVSRRLLVLASSAGQDVTPTSSVAMLLAPEKLIHSPRLRPYCQLLARGGVRFKGQEEQVAGGGSEVLEVPEATAADKRAAAELRINYVKHKVKRPKLEEELEELESELELDHSAWEQVPQATAGEMLCRASEAGLLPLVQLLLEQGAPVEGGELTGHFLRHKLTPLHLSVAGSHACCAELLLGRGAASMARDAHGSLPLHKAAERSGLHMVELLLRWAADAEAIDTASRSTALHFAARAGNAASAQALLAWGAGLDWLDRWNRTPLHWAVFHGHLELCKALVEAGASVHGTLGERGGRFYLAPTCCGNLPQRVSRQLERFVTPLGLAKERFGEGPLLDLLTGSLRGHEQLAACSRVGDG